MPSGAAVIAEALETAGVEVCFGLPGVHNLPLWEAVRRSSIRLVGVRHEQAAAYAADGYARATGRLGVALVTTGPGAANTLGAVGEAYASRSSVLVIATDIPASLRRPGVYRGVLHETTDQAAMFAPVTASTRVVASAAALPGDVAAALAVDGRPSYLQVPTDLLRADCPGAAPGLPAGRVHPMPDVRLAAEVLDRAARPLIWAGSGSRDAGAEVARLAERLGAPVLTTIAARGLLPPSHACVAGFPPHVEAVGRLWDDADVVVAVGTDFDGPSTQNWAQPQPPTLIAINVDPDDAAKNYRVDVPVTGDAAQACAALADRVAVREGGAETVRRRLGQVRAEACGTLDPEALRFLDCVAYGLPADAVVVCDMCIPGYWVGGFHAFAAPRKLQYPLGWGTLGYGFPAALGAALADTGPVVALCGDGGFLFACGELATVAQERLPLTVVIVDDGGYGMLRHDQDTAGTARFGVDLVTPDFQALAESFGVRAETVEGLDDGFGEALARHCADPEPSVLVSKGPALVPPPNTSPQWYRPRA